MSPAFAEGDRVTYRQGPPPRLPVGTVLVVVPVTGHAAQVIGDTQLVVVDCGNDAFGERSIQIGPASWFDKAQ
jgi:hypothetical protein